MKLTYEPVCDEKDYKFLYRLLAERNEIENISHRKMPTYQEHVEHLQTIPVKQYVIYTEGEKKPIGYLSFSDKGEIGLHFIKEEDTDENKEEVLRSVLKDKGQKYFINIAPRNKSLQVAAEKCGFRLIQYTYENIS